MEVVEGMEDVAIYVRCYQKELARKSMKFLERQPYPVKRLTHVGVWFERFLLGRVFNLDCRCVVLIDEDCFVFRPESLPELVEYMRDSGYAACGVPDGGVKGNPLNRSPIVPNLFLCAIDLERLRCYAGKTPYIHECDYDRNRVYELPSFMDGSMHNFKRLWEVYYRFFYWMLAHGERILYLKPHSKLDGSLVEDHLGREFAIHAWFARRFDRPSVRDHILAIWRYAHERFEGGN